MNKPLRSHSGRGRGRDAGTRADAGGGAEVRAVGVQISGEGAQTDRGGIDGGGGTDAGGRGADGRGK